MSSKLNIQQAKNIQIENFLDQLGYQPSHEKHGQIWYRSPFRDESTPSFKVNTELNLWYDFGIGAGGDIIDLVRQLENIDSVSQALVRILALMGAAPIPSRPRPVAAFAASRRSVQLETIGPIHSKGLQTYLTSRGIDYRRVGEYVTEAHYRCGQSTYYALAFKNVSGGYELRNPTFKGTLGKKNISVLEGDQQRVIVFEGFIDFLTAVMRQGGPLSGTVIVLNSVAMRDRAVRVITALKPRTVELYHDHDNAGTELANFLHEALPDIAFIDKSSLYQGHNDLNDWHASNCLEATYARSR